MRKQLLLFAVMLFTVNCAFSQGQIKGKVTDDLGLPIPNISVIVQGTKTGTTTSKDGTFSLDVSKNTVSLEISGIGFTSQMVNASVGVDLAVILIPEAIAIDEVIVTGTAGATQRKKMTVSVTKVGEAQLKAVPAFSVSSALTGKVAGLRSSSVGGNPGQQMDLLLRGDNVLNVSASPLILMDGIIMQGSLSDINVDDVESIEVVKGAAASALYGS